METARYIVILITSDSIEEADHIARVLLEKKKVACVNILRGIDSYFWWEGKVDSARENLLIAKTRASLLPEVVALVRKIHSYDVPEVIALPIIGGNQDYLEWIDRSTA
ncbi:MAG: divalent-cation tolerance protein CutA [Dehalococcoidia bacterium]|jgi:periplasmic divalent cation tolerance protein|nr:MAG: divalent-cation tolerance protein CutA [Dehalococcoidia bacterium]